MLLRVRNPIALGRGYSFDNNLLLGLYDEAPLVCNSGQTSSIDCTAATAAKPARRVDSTITYYTSPFATSGQSYGAKSTSTYTSISKIPLKTLKSLVLWCSSYISFYTSAYAGSTAHQSHHTKILPLLLATPPSSIHTFGSLQRGHRKRAWVSYKEADVLRPSPPAG